MLSGSKTAKEVKAEYDRFSGSGLILRDMDNHDTVTDWPYRIEGHFGHDAMDLILAVNYTLDGVPMVYCGNELADTARLSMFANRFYPGEFEFTDRKTATPESEKRSELIRFLNRIKAEDKALYEGETEWRETENDKVIAFTRKADSERITFYGNFSKEAADIVLPKNKEVLHSGGLSDGRLSSYGYIIFKEGE
jgi:glycosidase